MRLWRRREKWSWEGQWAVARPVEGKLAFSEGTRPLRALWIDDQPDSVRPVVSFLLKHGVDTEVIDDPVVGLSLALDGYADVIVLDERMPRLGGLEILIELRRQGVLIPVIVVSGYARIDRAIRATKLGAAHYAAKPCRAWAMLAAIRDALAGDGAVRGDDADREDGPSEILGILDQLEDSHHDDTEPEVATTAGPLCDPRSRALHRLALRLADRRLYVGEYLAGAKAFATIAGSAGPLTSGILRRLRQLLAVREGGDERLSSFLGAPEHSRGVSRTAVAAYLGVDPERLDRRLYDEFGVGLSKLRQHLAIRQAVFLLAETELQLKHIADDVGYRYPSAFTRDFHHCLAVSPSAFRHWLHDHTSG